jgi:hypothetical protein
MSVSCYERYRSFFSLASEPAFESFVAEEALYSTIEFSIKFRKLEDEFVINPQRYSIWKYKFDPSEHAQFLQRGYQCLHELATGTAAQNQICALERPPEALANAEFRYYAFGMEFSNQRERTRLKTYTGYQTTKKPKVPFIIRDEVNLNGQPKRVKYDGFPTADPRVPILLGESASILKRAPFLYCVYFESGRVHFKSEPTATHLALDLVNSLTNLPSSLTSKLTTLLDLNFQIEVVTFVKAELESKNIQTFTIYLRDRNWHR